MFLIGFFLGAAVGSLVTQLIIYVAMRRHYAKEGTPSASHNRPSDEIADYDCGMLNDHGGGNVSWWWDYLRSEIGRCNDYWRSATSHVG